MPLDLKQLVANRFGENYDLHERHLNRTLVSVQRTIGFDKVYANACGAYLFDRDGTPVLDFLSGYSVFNIGRNHPAVKRAISDALEMDLPNMVQMDCSLLSGLFAEALTKRLPPHLDAVFFCNSGTEAMEGAIKFARAATGRSGLISLDGSFHGLSMGALSLMGCEQFREGFAPYLPGCRRIALGDLKSLKAALATGDIAALIIEPVQGKGVHFPEDDFFNRAQKLCREHGALLICDEVQTGLGRTGKWFGFEHWNLEPDIVTLAKSLSGGYVPCGAIVMRRKIYQGTFSSLTRCVVHSSTFGRNNLAMACGLAHDRAGAVLANDRHDALEPPPSAHPGGRPWDGRDQDSAAAHDRRKRGRPFCHRARRGAGGVPEFPRAGMGPRGKHRPPLVARARLANGRSKSPLQVPQRPTMSTGVPGVTHW